MTVLRSALCGQYSLWQTWKEANTVLVLLQKPLTTVQAITRTNCGSDGSPTYQTRTLAGLCTSWIKSIGSRSDVKSWNSVLSQDSLEAVFCCLGLGHAVMALLVVLWTRSVQDSYCQDMAKYWLPVKQRVQYKLCMIVYTIHFGLLRCTSPNSWIYISFFSFFPLVNHSFLLGWLVQLSWVELMWVVSLFYYLHCDRYVIILARYQYGEIDLWKLKTFSRQ